MKKNVKLLHNDCKVSINYIIIVKGLEMSIKNLQDYEFCKKRKDSNNIEILLSLEPSKESNSIKMSYISLLLNNYQTTNSILSLNLKNLEKITKAIPSQMRTLLCLDSFNNKILQILISNPNGIVQYEYLKAVDYSALSNYINTTTTVASLNNDGLTQMAFDFN